MRHHYRIKAFDLLQRLKPLQLEKQAAEEKLELSKIIAPDVGIIQSTSIGFAENIVPGSRKQAAVSITPKE